MRIIASIPSTSNALTLHLTGFWTAIALSLLFAPAWRLSRIRSVLNARSIAIAGSLVCGATIAVVTAS
jgi:hypothetical protein